MTDVLPKGFDKKDSCIEVFYDGDCEMCVFIKEKAEVWGEHKIELIDIRRDENIKGFHRKQLLKEIHVIDEEGKVLKNIEAILKVLEMNPRFKFLVSIARLPFIKPLLGFGYKFVANNRRYMFGRYWRLYWTKLLVTLAFLVGLVMSSKLWMSTRLYPLSPVNESLQLVTPYPLDLLLLASLLVLLVIILLVSRVRKFMLAFLIILIFLFVQDQSRLQPWAYQYGFMLGLLSLFSWKTDTSEESQMSYILNTLRLLIAAIYIWSGAHKLNHVFTDEIFPWMNEPFGVLSSFMDPFAKLAPYVEMGIGIGLITKAFRKFAVFGALFMHTYILFSLTPIGRNWNSIVWPWNVAMMSFVWVLFWNSLETTRNVLFQKRFVSHFVILLFFIALPMLSFFGRWDSYLSFALYSGDTVEAQIRVDRSVYDQLPEEMQEFMRGSTSDLYTFEFYDFSMAEMNVPPYPESRIYKRIASDLCNYTLGPDDVKLRIYKHVTWFDKTWSVQNYDCHTL